jgi:hypothetical protein
MLCAALPSRDTLTRRSPSPDEGQIALFDAAGAERIVKRRQRRALFRDQQQARSFPVEPMGQFEKAGLGTLPAQLLDDTETDAAAAMDSHAGRLVDRQQAVVLVEDAVFAPGRHRSPGFAAQLQWRDAHLVAGPQPVLRGHPPAVHAHLAAPEYPVDETFRHALADAQQIIVDALALRLLADLAARHGGFA